MNGFYAAPTELNGNTAIGAGTLSSNTTGGGNTASGFQALQQNTTGSYNTAAGTGALQNNTTASYNTASGSYALNLNTTGSSNTAVGVQALGFNTTGNFNSALGQSALLQNTVGVLNTASGSYVLANNTDGNDNTASGSYALTNNTSGYDNTAVGLSALHDNTTGNSNIAIGYLAGVNVLGSNDIEIGHEGVASDGAAAFSGVIRIGTAGYQTSAYFQGISGASVPGGAAVYVNSNGQLGTSLSSRRFKEQITDMGDSSNKLLRLRPVNFFYKPEYDDGSQLLQYGLIAEEVEKIYPEMVAYDSDGQIMTVKYQSLAPMLLNEVQKLAAQNRHQDAQIRSQVEAIQLQQEENRKLEDRLAALEMLLSGGTAVAKPAGGQ